MHIVVAVDWKDQSTSALQETCELYNPDTLTLVHAVYLGPLESYPLVPLMEDKPYQDFKRARQHLITAAQQHLERMAETVPSTIPAIKRVCDVGSAISMTLDVADSTAADLIVVGHRGLGYLAEQTMGSVSHLILMHAQRSTLVVKGAARKPRRVVVAVKGPDDAERLQAWLIDHPFKVPVEVLVMTVVPLESGNSEEPGSLEQWAEPAKQSAKWVVDSMAKALNESSLPYTATGQVFAGDPTDRIAQEAAQCDLLVVSTHGRKGWHRFLFGSVSHSLVHRVPRSVLVIK